MSFGPKKVDFQSVLINSAGSLIAGLIGSIAILIISVIISNIISIPATFETARNGIQIGAIFPLMLSIITLIGTTITIFLTYKILNLTDPEKYKSNVIVLGQIAFLSLLTYIFITPMYIFAGLRDYDYIMIVFLLHIIIVSFGTSIILEIINNYRYILTGLYGSFVGLFISIIITYVVYTSFTSGSAKLISLMLLLPIINFSITFFKQLFEMVYFRYHIYTNNDQLGDIFYRIEQEEKQLQKEEEEKNSI